MSKFSDSSINSIKYNSNWKELNSKKEKKNIRCQTDVHMVNWELDSDMQTGNQYTRGTETEILQGEVSSSTTLLKYMTSTKPFSNQNQISKGKGNINNIIIGTFSNKGTRTGIIDDRIEMSIDEYVTNNIISGQVSVDCEVSTDPNMLLEADSFVELVDLHRDISTHVTEDMFSSKRNQSDLQTAINLSIDKFSSKKGNNDNNESKYDLDYDEKEDGKGNDNDGDNDGDEESRALSLFLRKITPGLFNILEENLDSRAFVGYKQRNAFNEEEDSENNSGEISHWKTLTVDLEKKKVIFPDWINANHHKGYITKSIVTRNKDRIYNIEFEDGIKLYGVQEEHIRVLITEDTDSKKDKKNSPEKSNKIRLPEGVRVHAKMIEKNGTEKYVPARVTKSHRAGTYDVECEGSRNLFGLNYDELMIGLEEGQYIEAKRPKKIHLQCTDVSWTCTGSSLVSSYGRLDITGWCDFPGAVCMWNIFRKDFNPDVPDFVLDHTSSLMCVKCHPVNPSIVSAGSYNGEVLVWDTNTPLSPIAISPVSEYSHKEPIRSLEWYKDTESEEWLLTSIATDGKIIMWKLLTNVQGSQRLQMKSCFVISNSKYGRSNSNAVSQSYGLTSMCFSYGGNFSRSSRIIVGQEGGSIVSCETSKLITNKEIRFTSSSSSRAFLKLFPIKKEEEKSSRNKDVSQPVGNAFNYDNSIGMVNDLNASPFNKKLFLSSSSDGSIKLFNSTSSTPLRNWEPVPPLGTEGISSTFSSINTCKFSPTRPMVFAAGSSDGFLYIYDLINPSSAPVAMLETPKLTETSKTRIGITGIAFNNIQRNFIAACDYSGRCHIWRLNTHLSNKQSLEDNLLDNIEK